MQALPELTEGPDLNPQAPLSSISLKKTELQHKSYNLTQSALNPQTQETPCTFKGTNIYLRRSLNHQDR